MVETSIGGKDVIFHVADADLCWIQVVGCFQVMENRHAAIHHVEGSCVAHEDGVMKSGVRLEEGCDVKRVIKGYGKGLCIAVFA